MALKRRTHTLPSGARARLQWLGGCGGGDAAFDANLGQTAAGADLGGSSKYSNESFEKPTKQDGIMIMLHQINPQISNLTH